MRHRSLHHYWRFLRSSNYWIFFATFVISAVVSVYALRQNNLTMIRLRDAVYVADKNGGDVEGALKNLREHIYRHMNSSPSSGGNAIKPPIQLKHTYERLVSAEKERVAAVNLKIYSEAQNYCEAQNSAFSGRSRVPCIEEYVSRNGTKEQPIEDSLYKFDFVSPRWSADVAGVSLIVSLISLFIFICLFGLDRWARWELKRYQ